ncbi:acetamidase/formamidase family protein [Halanaerobium congolense]|jgi:amidase|uniref:Amidase n=1 Tax=Halanaerobium congolense TaxID=54121 RepID=A0A1G6PA75_9FIRM|nr:acetamidase/formamidase family protein [Halanaerobium congolense]PXV69420.1 amidase [Halanaerobium congolense]TDS33781.1 amidase [Halanaerobium congolense]TDX46809.1 amidase [Halanaerobium congolense]SDC77033.1 amidase [Halanaerobium congolense]SDK39681.1 amidase [Halanaerobium congolense]
MRIGSKNVVYSMSAENKPAASCKPGETVVFETQDCFSNQIQTEDVLFETTDWDTVNPATGPLEIEGAEPGDTLKVEIKKMDLNDHGVMVAVPEMGFLNNFIEESETKIIPIEQNKAVFSDKIKIDLNPMIGVIGCSPGKDEEAVPCGTPASHGGNMDTKVITEGSTLYFPVKVSGAMLAMGDLHAAMGDGEVVISGVEIAGEVTVKVDVIKGKEITDPMVERNDAFYTIASGPTLDAAAKKAADNMFTFLKQRLDLENNELAMLMSVICDLQVSQVVDPEKTARMRVDKKALAEYNIQF